MDIEYRYKDSKKKTRANFVIAASSLSILLVGSVIFGALTAAYGATEQYSFVRKWGSQGDSDGQFEEPTGIAIDSSNKVYVSDMDFQNCCNQLHHRIQKFNEDGTFITKWGGSGAFVNPME